MDIISRSLIGEKIRFKSLVLDFNHEILLIIDSLNLVKTVCLSIRIQTGLLKIVKMWENFYVKLIIPYGLKKKMTLAKMNVTLNGYRTMDIAIEVPGF